jgi:hypothetical protein
MDQSLTEPTRYGGSEVGFHSGALVAVLLDEECQANAMIRISRPSLIHKPAIGSAVSLDDGPLDISQIDLSHRTIEGFEAAKRKWNETGSVFLTARLSI